MTLNIVMKHQYFFFDTSKTNNQWKNIDVSNKNIYVSGPYLG